MYGFNAFPIEFYLNKVEDVHNIQFIDTRILSRTCDKEYTGWCIRKLTVDS